MWMAQKGIGSGAGHQTVGKDAGNSRLASRKSRAKKGQASWSDCNAQLLQETIHRVVSQGALISFSQTTDGGAMVLYIKDGRDESKDYPASIDEVEEVLTDIHQTYNV